MYADLKELYEKRVVDINYLRRACIRGWITKKEFKEITGKEF